MEERRHLILDLVPMPEPDIGLPVRHPGTDDSEALAVLMLDAYEGTIDADGSETIDDARDEVAGYFAPERQPLPEHGFIALDGDMPFAAVLVCRHEELPFVAYVMTAAAQKGRGLATALTRLTLASLQAAGERQVHLWVTSGNDNAERIYERLGFHEVSGSAQPSAPRPTLTFREVTDANRAEVIRVKVAPGQDRFVNSVADAMEEAIEWARAKPWYRAVYAGDEPIGFVMLSWDVEPQPPDINGPWFLWKLIVDSRNQGKGYGREIVRMVVDLVRGEGGTELLTSHVPGDGSPAGFYAKLGFVPTGALDPNGEIILRLDLT